MLKLHIHDWFKINGKQKTKLPKKMNSKIMLNSKNFERSIKSPFMIYANLVAEDN